MNQASGPNTSDATAIGEVTRTVEDDFLAWYDADPERMRRALHPDLAKRSHLAQDGRPPVLRAVTAHLMIGWTAEGEGRETDPEKRRLRIVVDEIHDSIATAGWIRRTFGNTFTSPGPRTAGASSTRSGPGRIPRIPRSERGRVRTAEPVGGRYHRS